MLIRMHSHATAQRMLTPEAKKRLADSGITRRRDIDVRLVVGVGASASSNGMRAFGTPDFN